VLEQVNSN